MPLTAQALTDAYSRVRPYVHRTPVWTCQTINDLAGGEIFFKCENLQKIGAFKIRGGMNAVLQLSADQVRNGIATHSSGNHAQAIAYAARQVGTKAYIVMPDNSPTVKIEAVQGYGGEITFCAPNLQARETALQAIVDRTGATFIHPFNNEHVIAGQATAAMELLEDAPEVHVLIAPVGGGGLLSGTALAAHFFAPHVTVFAGEPEGANDAWLSMRAGTITPAPAVLTIADGLLTTVGDKTFPVMQKHVRQVITVTDDEIIAAMRLLWERMKMVVEPSGAVSLAAVLKAPEVFAGKKTGVILSGGNVDLQKLPF